MLLNWHPERETDGGGGRGEQAPERARRRRVPAARPGLRRAQHVGRLGARRVVSREGRGRSAGSAASKVAGLASGPSRRGGVAAKLLGLRVISFPSSMDVLQPAVLSCLLETVDIADCFDLTGRCNPNASPLVISVTACTSSTRDCFCILPLWMQYSRQTSLGYEEYVDEPSRMSWKRRRKSEEVL